MHKEERDALAITQVIADIAVFIPVLVDGVVDTYIADFLDKFLPQQVAAELNNMRDDTVLRLSQLTVIAHASRATMTAAENTFSP